MDDSKKNLEEENTEPVGLKKNLQTQSQSDKGQEAPNMQSPANAVETEPPADLQFAKEASEPGLAVADEVIEEQDEHDEEERKTQTDIFKKMGTANDAQPGQAMGNYDSQHMGSASVPSTMQA